jgi:feruloyl esterase
MEQWLDTGKAPDQILASHIEKGVVTRTRPLCAYPRVATYRRGNAGETPASINDAANFYCRMP